jgi:nitrogen fixation NifU-like protein
VSKDLKKLYGEVIRKLNDAPYHFEKKTAASSIVHADNPVCGDRFDVFMDCRDDKIEAIHFHGFGCAISKASTSMLVKTIEGKSLQEAEAICDNFLRFMIKDSQANVVILPSEHTAFSGVFEFPERVECATLAWKEMKKFLEGRRMNGKQ